MKKRSLVAALAMLMVSAIVLTSSTYAWFATNNKASLTAFDANVGNAAGSIYISADSGTTWKSTLSETDFKGIAKSLTPVSYDKANNHFYGGSFDEKQNFTLVATADKTFYTAISIDVYAEAAGTLTIKPALNDIVDVPYVYASVIVGDTATQSSVQYILGTTGDSYFPVVSNDKTNSATAKDNAPQNGIIDSAEALEKDNCALGAEVKVDYPGEIVVDLGAGVANKKTVTVYIWAEGQDSNCVGTSSGAPSFGMTFDYDQAEA